MENVTAAQARQLPPQAGRVPKPLSASAILKNLQRTHGNRFVQRFLAKGYETDGAFAVAPETEKAIQRARGHGQNLDSGIRAQMEGSFGANFSCVQVHTSAEADSLAQALGARAFTTGKDIFFSHGEYKPTSWAGRELLAHELTHVLQQGSHTIQGKLTVSQADDRYEQEADRCARAVMEQEEQTGSDSLRQAPVSGDNLPAITSDTAPQLQRLSVPLRGWGDVLQYFDDSSMELAVKASLWVAGRRIVERNFSNTQRESISIPLNTDAHLQIAGSVTVKRDNPVINDTNLWEIDYQWRVSVGERGALTVNAPTISFSGGSRDAPWSLSAMPVQGGSSVGLALRLGSTESTSSGKEVSVQLGGGNASAGYARSWGTSAGSTLTAERALVVDIETPAPPPEIVVGPITVGDRRAYYFNTGQAIPGTNPSTQEDENVRLTSFLRSLDTRGDGGSNLSGFVDGYASPRGGVERNRDLARARADYILSRIRDTLPRAGFSVRVYGEDIWRGQGVPNVDDSEKHRVVVLDIRRTIAAE
jgi:hypothetical protein